MKVLDRYIIRELFVPILYCSVILVFLILIADLFDNLDELLRYSTPTRIIAQYYMALIPQSFVEIIAWASWLGTVFLLVNLGFHNEITAMKTAGLKITTIIRPILFLGFLIGIFTFLIVDRIVPRTSQTADELREIYIEKKKDERFEQVLNNVTFYSKGNQLYYFRVYHKETGTADNIIALWLPDQTRRFGRKIVARNARWTQVGWELDGITEYRMDERGRILGEPRTYGKKLFPEMEFSPADLTAASSKTSSLTYKELKNWIGKLEENGVDVRSEYVDLHYRLAAPWQGLVMMLLTIPLLAKNTQRKAIALHVLVCVGIVFVYQVSGAIGVALGKASKLFPFVSAWAGNIIFSVGALMHLDRANH
ncbi:MAG: LptF/LptG family permease [Candidatus Omnitrophica bacterium]|nr:LptF/LptG family permease [Candidatus Omnitrophota bacterium]